MASSSAARNVPSSKSAHYTDLGNARRLVKAHGKDLRYCRSIGGWFVWDGRRWARDDNGEVLRRAKQTVLAIFSEAPRLKRDEQRAKLVRHALTSQGEARLHAMIALAESEAAIVVAPDDLDANSDLLNVLNGTLDLESGKLRPHKRSDLITKLAPVSYDPRAHHDLWDQYLDSSTAGDQELRAFLQRAVGYSLSGDTSEEKLFFVFGPEATGKTTFIEAIKAMLGDYAATTDFETFLKRPSTGAARSDIARLANVRFVASVEVDDGKHLAEGLVKQSTGGDRITARYLFKEYFEFTPRFKLWLAANHAPMVRDDDAAMWRRILRIPFEHTVPEDKRNPKMKATLRDPNVGGPAILAWAVKGYRAWRKGGLGVPPSVKEATDAYRAEMDPIAGFVEQCCALEEEAVSTAKGLWRAYCDWAQYTGGAAALKRPEFGQRLRSRGCEPRKGAQGVRLWHGIRLLDGDDETSADQDEGADE